MKDKPSPRTTLTILSLPISLTVIAIILGAVYPMAAWADDNSFRGDDGLDNQEGPSVAASLDWNQLEPEFWQIFHS
jgi:hypothetical protein